MEAKALWLQAQDHHLDRAPGKFSVYGSRGDGERRLLLRSRSMPRWDFMGWASWPLREASAFTHFQIVIYENCGNPEMLTLQRLWFEPAASGSLAQDDGGAVSSPWQISGPERAADVPDHSEREENPEYAATDD